MIRRHLARALLLGIALTFSAPAVRAQSPQAREEPGPPWGLVTWVWDTITTSWSDVGCWLDPHGACGTGQAPAPPPESEVGCWIDPYGCGAEQQPAPPDSDVGCWIDPNGGCRSGG